MKWSPFSFRLTNHLVINQGLREGGPGQAGFLWESRNKRLQEVFPKIHTLTRYQSAAWTVIIGAGGSQWLGEEELRAPPKCFRFSLIELFELHILSLARICTSRCLGNKFTFRKSIESNREGQSHTYPPAGWDSQMVSTSPRQRIQRYTWLTCNLVLLSQRELDEGPFLVEYKIVGI